MKKNPKDITKRNEDHLKKIDSGNYQEIKRIKKFLKYVYGSMWTKFLKENKLDKFPRK